MDGYRLLKGADIKKGRNCCKFNCGQRSKGPAKLPLCINWLGSIHVDTRYERIQTRGYGEAIIYTVSK